MPWDLAGNPNNTNNPALDIGPNSFLGSRGPVPLRIRTNAGANNRDVVHITSDPDPTRLGSIGIGGQTQPEATLDVWPSHRLSEFGDVRPATIQCLGRIHIYGAGGFPFGAGGYSFESGTSGSSFTPNPTRGERWEWYAGRDGPSRDDSHSARLWTGGDRLFVTSSGQLLLNGGVWRGVDLNVPFPTVRLVAPVPGELVLGGVRTSIRGFDGGPDDPSRPDTSPIRLGNHFIRTNGNESELWMAFSRGRTVSPVSGQLFRQLIAAVRWVGPSFDRPVPATPLDACLKTNVSQVEGTLEKLERIRGVAFEWAEAESPFALGGVPGQLSLGVVAQEVEEVFPEVVSIYDPDQEYKAVDYDGLTSVLIEAVKELKAQNDELRSQIEALEQA